METAKGNKEGYFDSVVVGRNKVLFVETVRSFPFWGTRKEHHVLRAPMNWKERGLEHSERFSAPGKVAQMSGAR